MTISLAEQILYGQFVSSSDVDNFVSGGLYSKWSLLGGVEWIARLSPN